MNVKDDNRVINEIEAYIERLVAEKPGMHSHAVQSGALLGLFDTLLDMDQDVPLGASLEILALILRN